jgi:hypothetical protein
LQLDSHSDIFIFMSLVKVSNSLTLADTESIDWFNSSIRLSVCFHSFHSCINVCDYLQNHI